MNHEVSCLKCMVLSGLHIDKSYSLGREVDRFSIAVHKAYTSSYYDPHHI